MKLMAPKGELKISEFGDNAKWVSITYWVGGRVEQGNHL